MGSEEEMHTVSRMPMPVNIAFAGRNGCRIAIRDRVLIKKKPFAARDCNAVW
jgi:hypothetical protein